MNKDEEQDEQVDPIEIAIDVEEDVEEQTDGKRKLAAAAPLVGNADVGEEEPNEENAGREYEERIRGGGGGGTRRLQTAMEKEPSSMYNVLRVNTQVNTASPSGDLSGLSGLNEETFSTHPRATLEDTGGGFPPIFFFPRIRRVWYKWKKRLGTAGGPPLPQAPNSPLLHTPSIYPPSVSPSFTTSSKGKFSGIFTSFPPFFPRTSSDLEHRLKKLHELYIGLVGIQVGYCFLNFVFGNVSGGVVTLITLLCSLFAHLDRRPASYVLVSLLNFCLGVLVIIALCTRVKGFDLYYPTPSDQQSTTIGTRPTSVVGKHALRNISLAHVPFCCLLSLLSVYLCMLLTCCVEKLKKSPGDWETKQKIDQENEEETADRAAGDVVTVAPYPSTAVISDWNYREGVWVKNSTKNMNRSNLLKKHYPVYYDNNIITNNKMLIEYPNRQCHRFKSKREQPNLIYYLKRNRPHKPWNAKEYIPPPCLRSSLSLPSVSFSSDDPSPGVSDTKAVIRSVSSPPPSQASTQLLDTRSKGEMNVSSIRQEDNDKKKENIKYYVEIKKEENNIQKPPEQELNGHSFDHQESKIGDPQMAPRTAPPLSTRLVVAPTCVAAKCPVQVLPMCYCPPRAEPQSKVSKTECDMNENEEIKHMENTDEYHTTTPDGRNQKNPGIIYYTRNESSETTTTKNSDTNELVEEERSSFDELEAKMGQNNPNTAEYLLGDSCLLRGAESAAGSAQTSGVAVRTWSGTRSLQKTCTRLTTPITPMSLVPTTSGGSTGTAADFVPL